MKYLIFIPLLLLFITGCTSGTIFKRVSIDDDKSTMVLDARQRVILITNKGGVYNRKTGGYRKLICAEPSPDVAVAVAAEGNFKLGGKTAGAEGNIEAGKKSTETITNLSQRTQTIQLLRDGLFRACEAHINGLINRKEYKDILNSYDDFVITILAIDGLTTETVNEKTAVIIKDIIAAYYEQQRWYIERKQGE